MIEITVNADGLYRLARWMTRRLGQHPATCLAAADVDDWEALSKSLLAAYDADGAEPRPVSLPLGIVQLLAADDFHIDTEPLQRALARAVGHTALRRLRDNARRGIQRLVGARLVEAVAAGLPVFEPGGVVALAKADLAITAAARCDGRAA